MPGVTEFSVQEILNRIYVSSGNFLAIGSSIGDGARTPASPASASEQRLWNLVFEPTLTVALVRMA